MNGIDTSTPSTRRIFLRQGTWAAAALTAPGLLLAQGYPAKPIRLVVPSAAGGAPDLICRILANELAAAVGQPLVIDNKPGAGGAIGMSDLASSAPDGHTLAYANVVTLAINRSLYANLSYDPDALTGVALLGTVQNALVVRNELPANNVQGLIALAKSRPGKLNMGSAGNGTTGHLGGELFKAMTGTFITHVPYRGSPMAIADLIGGGIDLMFDNLSSILPHIRSGRVRALGVSGAQRSPLLPDLPTIQESGVTGYETTAWGGIVGPSGMPGEIAQRLNTEINKILRNAAVREKYAQIAVETLESTPETIMNKARIETPRWADVIRRSGARVG